MDDLNSLMGNSANFDWEEWQRRINSAPTLTPVFGPNRNVPTTVVNDGFSLSPSSAQSNNNAHWNWQQNNPQATFATGFAPSGNFGPTDATFSVAPTDQMGAFGEMAQNQMTQGFDGSGNTPLIQISPAVGDVSSHQTYNPPPLRPRARSVSAAGDGSTITRTSHLSPGSSIPRPHSVNPYQTHRRVPSDPTTTNRSTIPDWARTLKRQLTDNVQKCMNDIAGEMKKHMLEITQLSGKCDALRTIFDGLNDTCTQGLQTVNERIVIANQRINMLDDWLKGRKMQEEGVSWPGLAAFESAPPTA